MPDVAFLNGRFMPISRARVSVEDRGFQFGDGVYEVLRTYGGRLFHPEDHLARLESSAAAIGLKTVYPGSRWGTILAEINRRCGYRNAKIYIQITRGAAPRDHVVSRRIKPTVVLTARRMASLPRALYARGVSIITVEDIRWGRCDIKTVNLLPNVMARQKAVSAGVQDAVFVRNGWVTEGATSNIFAVVRGRIVTPPLGNKILSGITRDCVISLAKSAGIPLVEEPLSMKALRGAEEIFLSSTTIEVLPVVRVDGGGVGSGRPGPVYRSLLEKFRGLTRG